MEIKPGLIVRSLAGRDKGKFLMVVRTGDGFVWVADGKERKIASPKKKNPRHIAVTRTALEPEGLTDKGLRTALRAYTDKTPGGE